jgi:diguanylate cyclase (GGDEF)-like protein
MDVGIPLNSGDTLGGSKNAKSAQLLRKMLLTHFENVRASIAANIVNASILFWVFSGLGYDQYLGLGYFALLLTIAHRISIAKDMNARTKDVYLLSNIAKRIEINAAILGGIWGIATIGLMKIASQDQQLIVIIIASGMMGAGSITYRTLKRAANLFVCFCCAGGIVAMLEIGGQVGIAATLLTMCYLAVLLNSIKTNSANLTQLTAREQQVRESADTINMLLANFTEQGADWLLEIDNNGAIIKPSDRFAEAAKRPKETLYGKHFIELFDDGIERAEFEDHIQSRRAFRNHAIPLSIGNEKLWWSISARPVQDDDIAYRGVITDISAQRKAEEQVSYMAHFDALTDLPNRFLFNQQLAQTLHGKNRKAALLYLDLDHFKSINDTLGHVVGDQLLREVAYRLQACVSCTEIVSRLGGDEFAIIVSKERIPMIAEIGQTIISALSEPFMIDGNDVTIGTSIGVALAPEHGSDGIILLRNADLALYDAKAQGRNMMVVFEHGMDEAAQSRRILEQDLRNALARDQLRLHYQPVVRIDDGHILGYEALIRWEHPERGVVMPNDFIPIAEDSGLIVQIGEWVIRQALDDLQMWPEDKTVAVNLSPVQMRSPSLISTLVNAIATTGVDAARICFEITETVLMHDSEANLATLHKLRDLGVEIALDDFGTGYSSLNYLRSFPFDKIKIDRCFINEIDSRADCRAIVRSVVDLALSLGMTTTAEGVEREDQVRHLRQEGCGQMQGYLFSKAVPQDQLTDLRKPILSHAQRLVKLETERLRIEHKDGNRAANAA